ncbi:hypothetical protein K7A41_07760 [Sphingobacterium sp. InxBP1]|uniref:hypothetical protein n=1 Tax=Sphingobacterium sp. InxBP1 TaxID=2870328 RepID=UPI002242E63D|nr:hypothetical protein [Sphingobacterium sp. InxBP1]MCW8311114.1 hypothetical protein [Sphingobacterium sp. InxBP1]
MLAWIKEKYRLHSCIGISLRQEGEALSFRCCKVRLDKQQLEIEETWEVADWELLSNSKNQMIPVALHLESRQILIKESTTLFQDQDQLRTIFPSYDAARFYSVQFRGDTTNWIAFVRKDFVSDILDRLDTAGYQVIKLFIGPFLLDNILEQLNSYSNEYYFDRHAIHINAESRQWQRYQWANSFESRFALKIGDHPIKPQFVTAYAAAFSTLMADYIGDLSLAVPKVEEQRQLWLEKQKFKNNLALLTGALFLLLLINTFLFSHYYQENQDLESRVSTQQSTQKDLGKLEAEIKQNEQLLSQLGWNGGVSKAWLLDQIAYTIRQYTQITLSQVQINPQTKALGNAVLQQPDQIVVKGNSPTLEMLNLWLRELKNNPWITKVSIEEYGNKQHDDTLDAFTIKINYNDQVEGN